MEAERDNVVIREHAVAKHVGQSKRVDVPMERLTEEARSIDTFGDTPPHRQMTRRTTQCGA